MYNIVMRNTVEFVKEFIPTPHAKILEVGCGRGELASQLLQLGYQVTAIDINAEAVAAAKELGVDAHVADIKEFGEPNTYDAVLFTHSLHHIYPLDTVLNRVRSILNEMGKILVEDFAIEAMDPKTATWFYELNDFVTTLSGKEVDPANPTDNLDRWKKAHHHEPALHTRKEMQRVMERDFGNIRATTVPYLYRYFQNKLSGFPGEEQALQRIYDWEVRAIEKGLINSMGLRIVAKRYFSYLK